MTDVMRDLPPMTDENTEQAAFTSAVEKYRSELQLHCYRMLASYEDAQDLVQETFLRAWKNRESLRDQSAGRAWLYRIATNACLDFLSQNAKRAHVDEPTDNTSEVTWLQPYPDRMIAEVESNIPPADAALVRKEHVELAFLVAVQLLPPNARAVLILRDVLAWSAKETAELLETTVASVNSTLQRARATLKKHVPAERERSATANADEQALVRSYMAATERGDAAALVHMLHEEARFSMPPTPEVFVGRENIVQGWVQGGFGSESFGTWRCIATSANKQPAVVGYLRRPGDSEYHVFAIDVLTIVDGKITHVTAFPGKELFRAFDVPQTISA
ncbi:MAG TPA: RNA polymerase subunit sigma-70 [Gemmatimonadaceae bacterium]|nr:RNA polymerase subunit sigma-70 [Gemmatimonadaceae bacterium]